MVQWLRFHALNTKGAGLIPDWGTEISQVTWDRQKKKKKKDQNPGECTCSVEFSMEDLTC